ncbi:leucyl aminopeptidase family protein [Actinotignum urinale]|uniref:leucyl aminopeptidase family protein n=1 Tax=Actinotignum urinale TaxID=190146 RepID=UPI0003B67FE4|nr:leucyl aminopeptidase [Actinotignum urinale]MDY5159898.1 leucyl aminopeptidase [Actinotignum urinale]
MTHFSLTSSTSISLVSPSEPPTSLLIVGACGDNATLLSAVLQGHNRSFVVDALRLLPDAGKKGALNRIILPETSTIVLAVGLSENLSTAELREVAGIVLRSCTHGESVTLDIPVTSPVELEALAEGALLGAYRFTRYKEVKTVEHIKIASALHNKNTEHDDTLGSPDAHNVSMCAPDALASLHRATVLADAQIMVRDLVNTPGGDMVPEDLKNIAEECAKKYGLRIQMWNREALEEVGCGGILGVGKGSEHPPYLVRIEWEGVENTDGGNTSIETDGTKHTHGENSGAKDTSSNHTHPENTGTNNAAQPKHIALVGKGITFDTGGLSLKVHGNMVNMKSDMAGSATVLATVVAASRLNLPTRVTAWMCIAENMLSGKATRVDDILTISDGTTVEVNNTDAEGRLVLADGLVFATKENPDMVIDIATLTGAQIMAFGSRTAAVMGSEATVASVIEAAKDAGEPMALAPLPQHLRSSLDSPVADMRNSGSREGGMLVAGLFLKEFTGDTPWAHIDVAGPSFNEGKAHGYTGKGGTGFGLRTLLTLAETA